MMRSFPFSLTYSSNSGNLSDCLPCADRLSFANEMFHELRKFKKEKKIAVLYTKDGVIRVKKLEKEV